MSTGDTFKLVQILSIMIQMGGLFKSVFQLPKLTKEEVERRMNDAKYSWWDRYRNLMQVLWCWWLGIYFIAMIVSCTVLYFTLWDDRPTWMMDYMIKTEEKNWWRLWWTERNNYYKGLLITKLLLILIKIIILFKIYRF